MMSEPTLQSISDYNTLSGEKRKTVWAVIIAGLIIGVAYSVAINYYGEADDAIVTGDMIGKMPKSY